MPDAASGPGSGPADGPPLDARAAGAAVGGGGSASGSPQSLPPKPSHAAFFAPADKPYLGGYRNVVTRALYHHAATQTDRQPALAAGARAACDVASTQTEKPRRNRAVQCACDAATQCPRPGWVEDRQQGRVLEPRGPYVSGEQVVARRHAAATTIQRHARGWLARRAVAPLRQARLDLAAFLTEQAARQEEEADEARRYEVQRRMQPRTRADFVLLYDELAMWWGQEQARIAAAEGTTEEERQGMRRALLAKETKLLQTIDRLKLAAAPVVRAERAERHLAAAAAPKQWVLGGRAVEVATPATLRAGELSAAYHRLLAADGTNMDARLAALLAVKYHAKAVDCSLTREIVGLVDREADLLNRGRDPEMMAGLRTRLANQFMEFVLREQAAAAAGTAAGAAPKSPQRRPSLRQPVTVQAA